MARDLALVSLLGGGWFASFNTHKDTGFVLNRRAIVKPAGDDALLKPWTSEAYDAPADAAPECEFWDMNIQYDANLCNHFTIGRSSSMPQRALQRALQCAAAFETECILSAEVGLAVPAAFVFGERGQAQTVLGPRLLPVESDQQHVRLVPPNGDGVTDTTTVVFNNTVHVEFLDGETKLLHSRVFSGQEAYCVQLLRLAFDPLCWEQLD